MFCNTFHTKCFSLPSLPSTIIILFHRIDSENSKQKNHGALALWLSISHTFPSIKATVDKSIAYICNPDKIDGELYVSSFGNAYTRENIKERIETRDKKRTEYKQRDYAKHKLIDTSSENFAESPGLQHWAEIANS